MSSAPRLSEDSAPEPPGQRLRPLRVFSLGEWLTLCGMFAAVAAASMPWKRLPPPAEALFPALYVSRSLAPATAFMLKFGPLSLGWVVVASAVACGALLLFTPAARERRFFLAMQTLLASTILGLACFHVGPFRGIYFAIAGALLLLTGGVLRFR